VKNVIINADDFGASPSVNKAIVELFDNGLLTSATLMANMPGFDDAVALAHKHHITHKIGTHLVLTEGKPLTKEMELIPYLFHKESTSRDSLVKKLFLLNKTQKSLIFNEYNAQIEKLKKNGIPVNHLDTHLHMHDMWGVLQVIIELLKVHQIPYVRILNNLNVTEYYKYTYRNLVNSYLKLKKVNYSDYFGSQEDFSLALQKNPAIFNKKTIEIMVHPDYNSQGKLIDLLPGREGGFDFLAH
jgi:predicted glycoside hydrolase/deacetylase ChbG (UPF0249 family)